MNVLFINDDSTSKIMASDLPFIENNKDIDIVISISYSNINELRKKTNENSNPINKYDIIFLTPVEDVKSDDVINIFKNMNNTAILIFRDSSSNVEEDITKFKKFLSETNYYYNFYKIMLTDAQLYILTYTNYNNLAIGKKSLVEYIPLNKENVDYNPSETSVKIFINDVIKAVYQYIKQTRQRFEYPPRNPFYEQPEHNYNYKNIAGICLLIIICAVTVWIIKYFYPYLKRKLTRTQLYIVMGIISIVLFGITAFILWYFISLFIQIRRDNYLKNYDMEQYVVPADAIPYSDEYKSSSQSEHEPAIQDHSNRISNSTNKHVLLNNDADAL